MLRNLRTGIMLSKRNYVALTILLSVSVSSLTAADGRGRIPIDLGAKEMPPILNRYYRDFVESKDIDVFVQNVMGRYNESTLIRIVESGDAEARRAAVLALGLVGGAASNAAVGERMKDMDPVVRSFAENALWGIWFRSSSPEENHELTTIRNLMSENRMDEAMDKVDRLIEKAPTFAEAWNQRAIIRFARGEWELSAQDCERVVELNPYHYGAISGMAQCHLKSGKPKKALEAFRKLVRIQPHNTMAQDAIDTLLSDEFAP